MSRRKLAAIAGVLPLGAAAVGTAFLVRGEDGNQHAEVRNSAETPARTAAGADTIPTQSAPPEGLQPEISKIGSRHIAALHAIHNYLAHISNYEPQSLDAYFAGAIETTTGACRQQLIDTRNSTREYFLSTNSRCQVIEFNAGLRAITGTTALGIGYVKQSTSSDLDPIPSISLIAAAVTAEEQPDGRWLISDVKRIST
ncbi:hypothetical protein [Nocardia sp. NPDC005978]|uniref:hypothetical protein n=1 Tax=unclassified Nocardia TaxID=2637762 RepID=UPI0033A548AC